jgi:hypothetical protein
VAATKVELFERIRRDSWREGLSIRVLARKYLADWTFLLMALLDYYARWRGGEASVAQT